MKDDNILLEALKEIAGRYYTCDANIEIANNAIEKYNQSPSDESNQDELFKELKSWCATYDENISDEIVNKLKSQYTITKKQQPPDAIAELNKFGEFKITVLKPPQTQSPE